MNKTERAALVREQYAGGVENGTAIAGVIIKQFPDGFPESVGAEVRKITDAALAHVVNAFQAGGVDKKYIRPFADGFTTGLKNTYREYADECSARALTNK
jgi:hypothetical protein